MFSVVTDSIRLFSLKCEGMIEGRWSHTGSKGGWLCCIWEKCWRSVMESRGF